MTREKRKTLDDIDGGFGYVRSYSNEITNEERIKRLNESFELFEKVSQRGRDIAMGRNIHPTFLSFLRRKDYHGMIAIADNIQRHYGFSEEGMLPTLAALSKFYDCQTDPNMKGAIFNVICAVGKGSTKEALEKTLESAPEKDPSAIKPLKNVYQMLTGSAYNNGTSQS